MAASKKRKRCDDEAEQYRPRKRRKLEAANGETATSQLQTNITHSRESSGSLLMNLPGELRNNIYSFALVEDETIQMSTTSANGEQFQWREPGLLSVSKRVRAETRAIYYSKNRFLICIRCDTVEQACPWIKDKRSLCRFIGEGTNESDISLQLRLSTKGKLKFWIALTSLFCGMKFGSDYCTDPRHFYREKLGDDFPINFRLGDGSYVRESYKLADLENLKESFYKWATFRGWDGRLKYELDRNLRDGSWTLEKLGS